MRLTAREREIIEYLKKEPLISQEELADRMGISRSSIGVHISNLIKKGIILGKGYVINEAISVVLYGESYWAVEVLENQEECRIDTAYCGVCFEVGDILNRFGLDIKAVTIIGSDLLGDEFIASLKEKGIDTEYVLRPANSRTCRRIFVNGHKTFEEGIAPEESVRLLESQDWLVFNCEWLMVEPAFADVISRKLSGKYTSKLPTLATWLLLDKAKSISDYFSQYSLLVLGLDDADELEKLKDMVPESMDLTGSSIVLTDGSSKVAYLENNKFYDFLLPPAQKFDCSNRLSYLTAGLVYGLSSGYPLRQAVRIAVGTASAN